MEITISKNVSSANIPKLSEYRFFGMNFSPKMPALPNDTISFGMAMTHRSNNDAEKIAETDLAKTAYGKASPDDVPELKKAFEKLNSREKVIILLHYGLIDNDYKKNKEIGELYGIEQSNISTSKTSALSKIPKKIITKLESYLQSITVTEGHKAPEELKYLLKFKKTVFEENYGAEKLEQFKSMIEPLDERQKVILTLRYGIQDNKHIPDSEIAKQLDMTTSNVLIIRRKAREKIKDKKMLAEMEKRTQRIQAQAAHDAPKNLKYLLKFKNTTYEQKYGEKELERLKKALEPLDERAKTIIILYYGIQDGKPGLSKDIGRFYGFVAAQESANLARIVAERKIKDKELIKNLEIYSQELMLPKELLYLLKSEKTAYEARYGEKELERLKKATKDLTPKEKLVFSLYYGIQDGKPLQQDAIGEKFGVSNSAISPIKIALMGKIHDEKFLSKLSEFSNIKNIQTGVPEQYKHLLKFENMHFEKKYGQEELEKLKKAFKPLDDRQKVILILYYGIQDDEKMDSKEIGKIFKLAAQGVNDTRKLALDKIKDEDILSKLTPTIPFGELLKLKNTAFETQYGKDALDEVKKEFKNLDERARVIIILTYGLQDKQPLNNRELGEKLDMTETGTEAAKQVALGKIKNKGLLEKFEEFAQKSEIPEEFMPFLKLENTNFEKKYGKEAAEDLKKAAKTLTDREKAIIIFYYGVHDGIYRTIEDTQKALNLSKFVIDRDKADAMKKMNNETLLKQLRRYRTELYVSRDYYMELPENLKYLLKLENTAFEEKYGGKALGDFKKMIEPLSDAAKIIFILFYGVQDRKPLDNEEIGKLFDKPHFWASVIRRNAISRMPEEYNELVMPNLRELKRKFAIRDLGAIKRPRVAGEKNIPEFSAHSIEMPKELEYLLKLENTNYEKRYGGKALEDFKTAIAPLTDCQKAMVILACGIQNGEFPTIKDLRKSFLLSKVRVRLVKKLAMQQIQDEEILAQLEKYRTDECMAKHFDLKVPENLKYLLELKNTNYEKRYGEKALEDFKTAMATFTDCQKVMVILFNGIQSGSYSSLNDLQEIFCLSGTAVQIIKAHAMKQIEDETLLTQLKKYKMELFVAKDYSVEVPENLKHLLKLEKTAFEEEHGKETLEKFKEMIEPLSDTAKINFILFYGIQDNKPLTVEEIGKFYNQPDFWSNSMRARIIKKLPDKYLELITSTLEKHRVKSVMQNLDPDIEMPKELEYLLELENTEYEKKYGKEALENLKNAMEFIPDSRKALIILAYGIQDGSCYTIEELQEAFNLPEHTVKVMRKLSVRHIKDEKVWAQLKEYRIGLLKAQYHNLEVPENLKHLLKLEKTSFERAYGKLNLENFKKMIDPLSDTVKVMFILFYGIQNGKPTSDEEIGKLYNKPIRWSKQLRSGIIGRLADEHRENIIPVLRQYRRRILITEILQYSNCAFEQKYGKDEVEKLKKEISHLTIREKCVINLSYGVKDGNVRTIAEISEVLGLAISTIVVIKRSAMDKLKDNPIIYKLEEFLDSIKYNPPEKVNELMEEHHDIALQMGEQLAHKYGFYGDSAQIALDALEDAAKMFKSGNFKGYLYSYINGYFLNHLKSSNKQQSLDFVMSDDSGTLLDITPSHKTETPQEIIQKNAEIQELYDSLSALPDKIRQIIELKFGLTGEAQEITEIAKILKLSEEKVTALYQEGLELLRNIKQ